MITSDQVFGDTGRGSSWAHPMDEGHAMMQCQLFGIEPPELLVLGRDMIVLSYATYYPSTEVQQFFNPVSVGLPVSAVDEDTVSL